MAPFVAILLMALVLGVACQGDFEPPALDSPLDPANGQLPATPEMSEPAPSCVDGTLQVRIDWTADDPTLAGYQIYRSLLNEDPGSLVASLPPDARTYVDGTTPGIPGLVPFTSYFYRIRALGRDGTPSLRSPARGCYTPACP
jgi:hypothetical protein